MTAPSPGGVQRWDFPARQGAESLEPDPDGDWVRYGDIAGMVGENERLRNALREYGAHSPVCCRVESAASWECTCGLTEALRGAAGEGE